MSDGLTIWKYALKPFGDTTLDIPAGPEFLSVQFQNGVPTLWVLVDTRRPALPYTINRYGTGWDVPDATGLRKHISTVFEGQFVWHFFVEGVLGQ
jgi:hypothetical protein